MSEIGWKTVTPGCSTEMNPCIVREPGPTAVLDDSPTEMCESNSSLVDKASTTRMGL